QTIDEPFAPEAVYELKIDSNGDVIVDITYQLRVTSSGGGAQTATLRRLEGEQAAKTTEGGQVIVEGVPVSTGREAHVTSAGDYRLFVARRSDPFLFDVEGALHNFPFSGKVF